MSDRRNCERPLPHESEASGLTSRTAGPANPAKGEKQRKKQRLQGKRETNERKGALEDRRADGPLPEGATEVFRREVLWTARYIRTKRTKSACCFMNRQEAAGLAALQATTARL